MLVSIIFMLMPKISTSGRGRPRWIKTRDNIIIRPENNLSQNEDEEDTLTLDEDPSNYESVIELIDYEFYEDIVDIFEEEDTSFEEEFEIDDLIYHYLTYGVE